MIIDHDQPMILLELIDKKIDFVFYIKLNNQSIYIVLDLLYLVPYFVRLCCKKKPHTQKVNNFYEPKQITIVYNGNIDHIFSRTHRVFINGKRKKSWDVFIDENTRHLFIN